MTSQTHARLLEPTRLGLVCIVVSLAVLTPNATQAQPQVPITASANPERATTFQEVAIAVEGIEECPSLETPFVVEEGLIEVALRTHCPILPPSPAPFRLHALIGGLPPGEWRVRVVLLDVVVTPLPTVAETTFVVVDPRFDVRVADDVVRQSQTVTTTIDAVGSCGLLSPRVIGDVIRLDLVGGPQSVCDPPPPPNASFRFTRELGPFPAGDYSVQLYAAWGGDGVARRVADTKLRVVAPTTCKPDEHTLCLRDGRFEVTALWEAAFDAFFRAQALPSTRETGFFWLFDEDNLELMVKVLDGCAAGSDHFWVFIGGVTDLPIFVGVRDRETGASKTYYSRRGSAFETVNDTAAFPCAP